MPNWGDTNDNDDDYCADKGGGPAPAASVTPAGPPTRQRLQLKPRSAVRSTDANASSSSKPSPFGAARTREEVLASKGIDPKLVEARIERKAVPLRLSKDQDEDLRALRAELAHAEAALRSANENEMPEEVHRVRVTGKKTELDEMIEQFRTVNLEKQKAAGSTGPRSTPGTGPMSGRGDGGGRGGGRGSGAGEERKKFERPSERRRRLEMERGAAEGGGGQYEDQGRQRDKYSGGDEGGDDAFANFGGRSKYGSDRGGSRGEDAGYAQDRGNGGGYGRR